MKVSTQGWWWLGAYLICMLLVVWGMQRARQFATATYGTADAQSEWDAWRQAASRDTGAGQPVTTGVQRRLPKSEAPPALVLMRDYYTSCLVFALLMSSALFGTLMIAVRGIFERGDRGGSATTA